ncbi:nuclease [Seminavis robusta]|uniref:Nuclease n=1 Tax=Seminavis robusta TaxID=568900 RepID=A0A9N8DIW1_9STRA|nr:nuclease [Seminavis robusta]|eukprot:Sro107_g053810.1 nuclease (387) ;mRNA; f:45527-46687
MAVTLKTKMPSLSCCSPVLLIVWILVVTSPIGVLGWGKDGHELVGNLAYRLLSSSAQSAVHEILGDDDAVAHHADCYNNTPLGAIADWADQVRMSKDYHWSGVLHYIDIHDETVEGGCPAVGDTDKKGCHFDYSRDCKQDACVAGAIVNYTHHLADWKQQQPRLSKHLRGSMSLLAPFRLLATTTTNPPTQLVQESLKFLTHFVGDIHQPLHSGRQSDIGGNRIDVTFHIPSSSNNRAVSTPRRSGRRTTTTTHHHHHLELHAVWDTSMIERAIHTIYHHSRQELEEDLMTYIQNNNSTHHDWLACADTSQQKCTSAWAEESWQHALTWAYRNADGQSEVTPGTNLTDAYYETRWPQIFQYIAVAGVRLAAALEMVLGDDKNHHLD